jgi:uncharacterized membrane protein YedE/YeeE
MSTRTPRPYADAGQAGIALGILLLVSFVVAGRGLGASGAFATAAGETLARLAPGALADPAVADRLPSGASLADDWIVWEILGVFAGGALSAWLAGRWRARGEVPSGSRLARALAGGALMGLGARLAYGCTSGLALSGGALLATGAWVFIPVAFGTAMVVTLLARARRDGASS